MRSPVLRASFPPGPTNIRPPALARAGAAGHGFLRDSSRPCSAKLRLLLAVDDAHWLDRATLLALVAMLRTHAARPVLVVLAFSRDPASEEIDRLRSRVSGTSLAGSFISRPSRRGPPASSPRGPCPGTTTTRSIGRRGGSRPTQVAFRSSPSKCSMLCRSASKLSDAPPWPRPLATLSDTLPADLSDNAVAAVRVGFRRLSKDAQQALASRPCSEARITEADLGPILGWERGRLELALDELEWTRWLAADARGYTFSPAWCGRSSPEIFSPPGSAAGSRPNLLGPCLNGNPAGRN